MPNPDSYVFAMDMNRNVLDHRLGFRLGTIVREIRSGINVPVHGLGLRTFSSEPGHQKQEDANKPWVATADKLPYSLRSVTPAPPCHHI
jgi:hypothetical protein